MTQEIIDTGDLPNDGSGDPLRLAFDKINNNFANLFTLTSANSQLVELVDPFGPNAEPYISNSSGNTNNINIGNVYITNTFDSSVPVITKKALSAPPPLTYTTGPYGNQEYINIGATPNDGNGDPLRVAFGKINNNFSNLFLTTTLTTTSYTVGDAQEQVIFEVPATEFYQAQIQIRSYNNETPDMQDITLSASITNNLAGVRFSGHSTLFEGNAICRYDMDVFDGNVRVLINPLVDAVLGHFISALVTYPNILNPGADIQLNGYPNGYLMGTENELILTTESV
jgi:hypothetical protein